MSEQLTGIAALRAAEEIDFLLLYEVLDIPLVILGLANLVLILVLLKWHLGNNREFDFRRALIDPATKAVSFTRLGIFVALWASTEWGMYLIAVDKFSEWFYGGYMTAWVAYGIMSKNADAKMVIAGAKKPGFDDMEDPRP